MLLQLESVILFVHDIDAAAAWYAALLGVSVEHENPHFAFVRAPDGVIIGFHPADAKNPGGVPGTTPYWEVADFDAALASAESQLLPRPAFELHGMRLSAVPRNLTSAA